MLAAAAAVVTAAAAAAAPRCDAGLLFKHASVPQVVSSVKAEYPPVGNYHFNAYLSLIEKVSQIFGAKLASFWRPKGVSRENLSRDGV